MKKTPNGWRRGKVDEFFTLQRGFDITKREVNPGTIPVISSSGISYYHSIAKVNPPGVITGRKGSLGQVYLIKTPFWPHDTTLWVKDFKGNVPEFVKIFLEGLRLERFDAATSVPTLNRNNVHSLIVPFPPLDEQRRIAETLGEWDKAITLTERLIEAKQRRKKSLMQQLLTGKTRFGEFVGSEWKRITLEKITVPKVGLKRGPFGGSLKKAFFVESGHKVYEQKNAIYRDAILGNYYISEEKFLELRKFEVLPADFLVSCSGTIGRIFQVPAGAEKGVINQALLRIRVDKSIIDPSSFKYQFESEPMQKTIIDNTHGGAMQNLVAMQVFRQVRFFVPALEEQRRIAAVLQACDAEIELLGRKLSALKRQKKGLMQVLLTGRVRV